MAEIKSFTDLDLNFNAHPLTGNVTPKVNIDAIQQSMRILFSLNPYDIPYVIDTNANMRRYLFEPLTRITIASIRATCETMVAKWEPRVNLQTVEVEPLENEQGFTITLTYQINALNITDQFTQYFRRVR